MSCYGMLHLTRQRGALAELLVAYRFLEAGRLVSWPLVPCAYDLLVDGGDRIYRVQVKQAHIQGDMPEHWRVGLTKRRNTKPDRPQAVTSLDLICVVCTPAEIFVIPVGACASPVDARWLNARLKIGPESRYRVFLNKFGVGTGIGVEGTPEPFLPLRYAASTLREERRTLAGGRKAHHRLTTAQVHELFKLPIRWVKAQPPTGLIPIEDIAQQFNVSVATLRNLARLQRKDLRQTATTP